MFKKVAVGGTFDHLHEGHIALLTTCFKVGEQVLVGVSSGKLARGKGAEQGFRVRLQNLRNFLKSRGWLERCQFEELHDPFGSALNDRELEAIVVSPETRERAKELNFKRREKGLPELVIVEVPWVLAEDGFPISSERIRRKEIDIHGRVIKRSRRISG
ncbi:MAG: pantetheine-phosphate adenylyltransferase [Candidatus Hadarchaeales archaeon]